MSGRQRAGFLGAALVVIIVAVIVAVSSGGGDDTTTRTAADPAVSTRADGTSTAAPGDGTVTAEGTGGAAAPAAEDVIVITGGKPDGGVKTLKFKKGGRITFTVKSDVADEIHFHGYDVSKDVTKGGTVSFDVPATIDGRFEVELEHAGVQIANVEVEP